MKGEWLVRRGREDLILFFSGWGMDGTPFREIGAAAHDVLTLYDYKELDIQDDLLRQTESYKQVRAVGWSFGMLALCEKFFLFKNLTDVTAVNATLKPIDRCFGIDPVIFEKTLCSYSRENREIFYGNMFADQKERQRFLCCRPQRSAEDQIAELVSIKERVKEKNFAGREFGTFPLSKVIVGRADKIIPAKHQSAFWQGRCPIEKKRGGALPLLRQ